VLAPFVAARLPEAVDVRLRAPADAAAEERRTTPYGLELKLGGWGSWTERYQSADLSGRAQLFRLTPRDGAGLAVDYLREVERQPNLEVGGAKVPMTFDAEELAGSVHAHRALSRRWTVGVVGRVGHQDGDGQYLATTRLHFGIERDWFAADDPRGNRLAAAWLVGVQDDIYRRPNVLAETSARFPTHMLLLEGDVRFDRVELELDLAAQAELLRPARRYVLSANGAARLILGSHLDLALGLGVTRQVVPGPAELDPGNFEQVRRASYAEPLQMSAELTLRVHFDPTNGARNDRFEAAIELDATDNL
jgi:hypothetical protein